MQKICAAGCVQFFLTGSVVVAENREWPHIGMVQKIKETNYTLLCDLARILRINL